MLTLRQRTSESRYYPHLLMAAATVLWATLPLGAAITGGTRNITVNVALFGFCAAATIAVYLKATAPDLLKHSHLKAALAKTVRGSFILQRADVVFYLLGIAWASPEIAAVLVEAWAVWYVIVSVRWRIDKLGSQLWTLFWMLVGFAGAAAVIVSQSSRITWGAALGVASVGLAGFLGGVNIKTTLAYGEDLKRELDGGGDREHWGLLCLGWASLIIGAAAAAIAVWQTTAERGGGFAAVSATEYGWMLFLWLFAMPTSLILIRVSNSRRQDTQIGVNAIAYISAPMAVVFLLAAGQADIVSHGWFWLGMFAVIGANVLLQRPQHAADQTC